jgi:enamine deaminase RidA (YjgF/YER057c/UK114 family)
MGAIEARLAALGMVLPAPAKVPPGVTLLFPWVNVRGARAFVSGHGGLEPDGSLAGPFGKVGAEVDLAAARGLAGKTALAMLASLSEALGDLDRIEGWARVFGMVNSAPGFHRQPEVINGFSELILDVFGPEAGRHARSAVGVAELPFDIAVEIEAEVLLRQ